MDTSTHFGFSAINESPKYVGESNFPGATSAEESNQSGSGSRVEDGLQLIAARCDLKAQATRRAFERQLNIGIGTGPLTERDRQLLAKAKVLPHCSLWMLRASASLASLEQLVGNFKVLGKAVELVLSIKEEDHDGMKFWKSAAFLMAEAQSALFAGVQAVHPYVDNDQQAAYWWLRAETDSRAVFIPRYMRSNDIADPGQWQDLAGRIDTLGESFRAWCDKVERRAGMFSRLRHHVASAQPAGHSYNWQQVIESVEQLIGDGVPPSSVDVREALLPVADRLLNQEDLPQGVRSVRREIEQHLLVGSEQAKDRTPTKPTPSVNKVAGLLRGRTVVVIGGDARPHARQAFQDAFLIKELIWVDTRPHQSISTFEHYIKRPEVAVVLLLIRWSSHSYGELKPICDKWRKAFARLPGGYGPNQVAEQIVSQCGAQLEEVQG